MAAPDLRTPEALARAVDEAADHYRQGRLDDADKVCTRVLKAAPDWFDALHLAGLVKLEAGKAAAAQVLLAKALKLNPDAAPVLANLGRALSALNRDDEAMASLDQALAIAPDSFDAVNIRGHVLLKLKRAHEAVAAFERVLALEPRFLGARANLGNALAQLGRFEEALAQYDALLAAHPGHPEILVNRGSALAGLGRLEEALAAYDGAIAQRADYGKARIGRGATLAALNRHQEALEEYATALAADKSNADIQHNEALSLLTLGDYRARLPEIRGALAARRHAAPQEPRQAALARRVSARAQDHPGPCRAGARRCHPVRALCAAACARRRQGGDGGASRARRAAVAPRRRRRASSAVATRCRPTTCIARSAACRWRCAPTLRPFPANVPYLAAIDERVEKWRARIGQLPSPRIAVAWSGSADHANDRNRSIAFERLAPLFAQGRGASSASSANCATATPMRSRGLPNVTHVGDALADFDDTAAVMALADLVISVDTSVVHLAGAMGAAGVGAAAVPAGLALAARSRGLALVSDRAAVPSAKARRLGERDCAGEGRTCRAAFASE